MSRPRSQLPRRHQIDLGTVLAAGARLDELHLVELRPQLGQHAAGVAALEVLGHEGAAGLERADGEVGGDLDQGDDLQVVGLAMADGVVGHVRQNQVRPPAQGLDQLVVDARLGEVGLDQDGNKGFEGLTWDHIRQELLVVKERDPLRLLLIKGFVEPTDDGSISITEVKRSDSDQLFMADLSAVSLDEDSGHVLLLSDQSHMAVEYDRDRQAISVLGLWRGMSGLAATVPQAEGIAIDAQKRIYIVSEPNLFYRFVREN